MTTTKQHAITSTCDNQKPSSHSPPSSPSPLSCSVFCVCSVAVVSSLSTTISSLSAGAAAASSASSSSSSSSSGLIAARVPSSASPATRYSSLVGYLGRVIDLLYVESVDVARVLSAHLGSRYDAHVHRGGRCEAEQALLRDRDHAKQIALDELVPPPQLPTLPVITMPQHTNPINVRYAATLIYPITQNIRQQIDMLVAKIIGKRNKKQKQKQKQQCNNNKAKATKQHITHST